MKLFLDFLPVIVFFAGFKMYDIYVGTIAAIVATVLVMMYQKVRGMPIETMQWVGLVIIVVFGGATVLLQDETFIKWKPTVLYWLFALVLIGSVLIAKKNLIQALMGKQLSVPNAIWSRINWLWAGFFTAMGFINWYVASNYSTDTWVNFKMFGSLGLTLVFIIGQAVYLGRHAETDETT
jgi:intracellular septation protein